MSNTRSIPFALFVIFHTEAQMTRGWNPSRGSNRPSSDMARGGRGKGHAKLGDGKGDGEREREGLLAVCS